MQYILPALGVLFLIFIGVLVVRALMFIPPKAKAVTEYKVDLNEEKIITDMQDMIRCKTVSYREEEKIDRAEFAKFEALLSERFPLIHKTATKEKIGNSGLLYHIKGASDAAPSVCMAHYDVVPVNEAGWDKPAFEGVLEDGFLWGRGTLDTKGTLCALLEGLESLLDDGFCPKNDLYLSFSGEEEVDGDSCRQIVSYLEEKGVRPAFVLDEGGAVVEKVFPGVSKPCALIGVDEKMGINLDLTILSDGGHASTPPSKTVLGRLSKAVLKLEKQPFPMYLAAPVKEMFDTLGRHSSFLFRLLFSNLWCFTPLLNLYGRLCGGELGALIRTTIAVTRMEGSDAYNVLPPKAKCGLNMRLLANETVESAMERVKKCIKDDKIAVTLVNTTGDSSESKTSGQAWEILTETVSELWPDAIVSPYLMLACSDSRQYSCISDHVYRFSAMRLSKEERGMIHGNNERIPVETLLHTVRFYHRLLQKL